MKEKGTGTALLNDFENNTEGAFVETGAGDFELTNLAG